MPTVNPPATIATAGCCVADRTLVMRSAPFLYGKRDAARQRDRSLLVREFRKRAFADGKLRVPQIAVRIEYQIMDVRVGRRADELANPFAVGRDVRDLADGIPEAATRLGKPDVAVGTGGDVERPRESGRRLPFGK